MGWGRSHLQWMRLANPGAAMKRLPEVGFGPAHGYLYLHVSPRAVAKHLEWNIAEILGNPVKLNWQPQTLRPGALKAELSWSSLVGCGSKLASSLKGWHYLTFEVYESAGATGEGSLYMFTPELGLFRGTIGTTGDLLINENQLQSILRENLRTTDLAEEIEKLMGKKWDIALEPFRFARENLELFTDKIPV
jgi:Protein of unknown function (DUF3145)